jgi:hypothetical protein
MHDAEPSDREGWLARRRPIVLYVLALLLLGLVVGVIRSARRRATAAATALELAQVTAALKLYWADHSAYPPDDITLVGGSARYGTNEVLVHYLARELKVKGRIRPPYLSISGERLADEDFDGFQEYRGLLGNLYRYAENASHEKPTGKNPKTYDLVNPGPDGELGGTILPATGYVPAITPKGKAREKDNVTSWSR